MENNKKLRYTKPEISELTHDLTAATKKTPSKVEGQNPGGNADITKFGS